MSGPGEVTLTATLRVWRGIRRDAGRFEDFEIPFEAGESVLDGLSRIRALHDPGLAFRFSCISSNICKECTMRIDGKVQYACVAKLTEGVTEVAPSPSHDVVRDLITDNLSAQEKL